MVCDILPSQDAATRQIWGSYLKKYEIFSEHNYSKTLVIGHGHSDP